MRTHFRYINIFFIRKDYILGHVYAIGDCGGANQHGICPECKSQIGGMGHLVTGNTTALEMTS